jgi:hypothetical protein
MHVVQAGEKKELQNKKAELEIALKNEQHKLGRVADVLAAFNALPAGGGLPQEEVTRHICSRESKLSAPHAGSQLAGSTSLAAGPRGLTLTAGCFAGTCNPSSYLSLTALPCSERGCYY